jgi:hypothetical protein
MTSRPAQLGALALLAFALVVLGVRGGWAGPTPVPSGNTNRPALHRPDPLPLSCALREDHPTQLRAELRYPNLKAWRHSPILSTDGPARSWSARPESRCPALPRPRLHVLLCTWLT